MHHENNNNDIYSIIQALHGLLYGIENVSCYKSSYTSIFNNKCHPLPPNTHTTTPAPTQRTRTGH